VDGNKGQTAKWEKGEGDKRRLGSGRNVSGARRFGILEKEGDRR
jgi:hypothetical protein